MSLLAPSASFTAYSLTLPPTTGTNGQVLTTNGSGALSWSSITANALSSTLSSGQIYVGNSANVGTAVTPTGDVTLANTGAFTVVGLQGVGIGTSAPTTAGQVVRYDGSKYQAAFLTMNDVHSITSGTGAIFPTTNCTAGQTLTYSSITDQFTCTDISITASQNCIGPRHRRVLECRNRREQRR